LSSNAKVAEKVTGDDPIDVAILTKPLFDKLVRAGKLVGGTAVQLARVPIGLAVRQGAPKPDIGSVEAFKKTLLDAKFITYGDPGIGDDAGIRVAKTLETLGLAGEMRPKTRLISPSPGQSGAQFLTGQCERGETEVAMAPISVLMEIQGVEIVGLLPAELQAFDLVFFAGTPWTCRQPLEAKTFIDFLTGASAKAVYRALVHYWDTDIRHLGRSMNVQGNRASDGCPSPRPPSDSAGRCQEPPLTGPLPNPRGRP
jgi:molybdate transport system substrate-binding protein